MCLMILKLAEINTYYDESHVLQDVSLKMLSGELIAILGRNGVGKSTTLKSIMMLTPPRNGSVIFDNQELMGKRPFLIARMGLGYVPEERRIFPGLTVRENLVMGITSASTNSNDEAWTIDRVYSKFSILKDKDKTLGGALSGGEQQVLTLARTLMGNPKLILIDEPSEGLSPAMVELIYDIVIDLHQKGISIILVDQNLSLTCEVAQRVYIMSKGRIVFSGTGREILENKEIQELFLAV